MAPEPSALLLFGNSAAEAEDVVVGATKDQKKKSSKTKPRARERRESD